MMGLLLSLVYATIPIGLVIAAAALVRKRGNPESAGQRTFLFLAWTALGILALLIINWIFPNPIYGFVNILAVIIPALVAMTFLQAREWRDLPGRQKKAILSVLLLTLSIIAAFLLSNGTDPYRGSETVLRGMLFLSLSAFLFAIWKWGQRYPILLGILAILFLAIFNGLEMGSLSLPPDPSPGSLASTALVALVYLLIPGFAITTTGMLVLHSLQPALGPDGSGMAIRKSLIAQWALIVALLGLIGYTYVWLWIWDGVDDGVRFILLLMATTITVFSTGLLIALTSSGWRRWVGLPYTVLVLALVYAAGAVIGTRVSNYSITEARAKRIQEAIESYHAKTGMYPADLQELTPAELWRIPLPMVIPDQGWCYEGGPEYYRLGLVYREHWSSPYLSVRVVASTGDFPEESWACDQKLAELREMQFSSPPKQAPLPASSVSVPKTVVTPVLSGRSISVGSWSPGGRYLVFGPVEYFLEEVEHATIDLYFLEAGNGNICQPAESGWTVQKSNGLSEHHAWLPDGRFLYVPGSGEMWAYLPCSGDAEDLSKGFSNRFTYIVSFHEQSGQMLLKDQDGLWLLNGKSLALRKIVGIPTETYWAWYAWTRDGKRLAASQMMGPEQADEAFLFIVDTETGELEAEMALQEASDANLPLVEWLTRDELLLQGKSLTVMDFRFDPPKTIDLLRDVFLLDIEYPMDVSSMDTHSNPDGDGYTLGVRVNHPHNQGVYLYDSKAGRVQVVEHDTHSLFFFPDGGWMRLPAWEGVPSDTDEYEMVWVERPLEARRLVVEGHIPRSQSQMFPRYLPGSSRLVFSSSQGVSLVSIPGGETVRFWELSDSADFFSVFPSPNEEALVVAADGGGLYYIPLPPQ